MRVGGPMFRVRVTKTILVDTTLYLNLEVHFLPVCLKQGPSCLDLPIFLIKKVQVPVTWFKSYDNNVCLELLPYTRGWVREGGPFSQMR